MHTSIETDYTAPEITGYVDVEDEASCYTSAVDMWSLGCLIHWLLTQELPLSRRQLLFFCMEKIPLPQRDLQANHVSANGIDFICKVLQPKPQAQLIAFNALEHGWPRGLSVESTLGQDVVIEPHKEHDPGLLSSMPAAGLLQKNQIPQLVLPDITDTRDGVAEDSTPLKDNSRPNSIANLSQLQDTLKSEVETPLETSQNPIIPPSNVVGAFESLDVGGSQANSLGPNGRDLTNVPNNQKLPQENEVKTTSESDFRIVPLAEEVIQERSINNHITTSNLDVESIPSILYPTASQDIAVDKSSGED